jgi:hypothetical protein
MKKIGVLVLWMGLVCTLQAQYFVKELSGSGEPSLNDGIAVDSNHFMTGRLSGTTERFALVKTDGFGNTVSTGTFNKAYILRHSGGFDLHCSAHEVFALQNGQIMVVGKYNFPIEIARGGIFTALLDTQGLPISVVGYTGSDGTTNPFEGIPAACQDISIPNRIFITCGFNTSLFSSTSPNGIAVMSINGSTNTANWTRAYDCTSIANELPTDIVSSNYNGVPSLTIVGNFPLASDVKSFVLTLRSTSGTNPYFSTFGYTGSWAGISSITLATTNSGGSSGFVLCGVTTQGGIWRPWILKLNKYATTILWNKTISHSYLNYYVGIYRGYALQTDVFERKNTTGQAFYYCSITGFNYSPLLGEACVFKIKDGGGTTAGQYTYSDPLKYFFIRSISGTSDGFSLYSNTYNNATPGYTFHAIKAKYNGLTTSCITTNIDTATINTPPTLTLLRSPVSSSNPFFVETLSLLQYTFSPSVTGCDTSSVTGGGNYNPLRLLENQNEETISSKGSIGPNPISTSEPALNISLKLAFEQQVQFRVVDLNGREVFNQQVYVSEGNSNTRLDLPAHLSPGVYLIQIRGEGYLENHRFIIE